MATTTDNYQLLKPTYAEQADIGVINSNMNIIDDIMHSSQISLAPAYDSTQTYAEGDVVMYELLMYKCISPTTGVWDGSKWERTTASESGGGGSAELDILGEGNGAIVSFADGASAGLAKCIAEIVPTQAGSGTPSPSNVRAISSYTSANISVNGKNFLNFAVSSTISTTELTLTPLGDGGFRINGTTTSAGVLVWNTELTNGGTSATANQGKKTLPNGTYKFTTLTNGLNVQVRGSNTPSGGDNPIATTVYGEEFTIDDTYRYNWIRIQFSSGVTFNNETFYPMIRLATETANYEPYNGSTTTTPLGQTVYGGQLNVLTGILNITWGYIASYNGETLPNEWISDRDEYASGTTPTTGAEVAYKLATPQTVQLTPQEVNSLLGQNNISADTGDIDIVYVKASAPIQPNPTGTPTATLSKLGIEGTVFEVSSGGGGSSSGIVIDGTERVIGTYFGKPLYQRVITPTITTSATLAGDLKYGSFALADYISSVDMAFVDLSASYIEPITGATRAIVSASYEKDSGDVIIMTMFARTNSPSSLCIKYTKITD